MAAPPDVQEPVVALVRAIGAEHGFVDAVVRTSKVGGRLDLECRVPGPRRHDGAAVRRGPGRTRTTAHRLGAPRGDVRGGSPATGAGPRNGGRVGSAGAIVADAPARPRPGGHLRVRPRRRAGRAAGRPAGHRRGGDPGHGHRDRRRRHPRPADRRGTPGHLQRLAVPDRGHRGRADRLPPGPPAGAAGRADHGARRRRAEPVRGDRGEQSARLRARRGSGDHPRRDHRCRRRHAARSCCGADPGGAGGGLYAIPAIIGAAITVAAGRLGLFGPMAALAAATVCFLVRLLGIVFGLDAPRPPGRDRAADRSAPGAGEDQVEKPERRPSWTPGSGRRRANTGMSRSTFVAATTSSIEQVLATVRTG